MISRVPKLLNQWFSVEELKRDLVVGGDDKEPIVRLIQWIEARYRFEAATCIQFYSDRLGLLNKLDLIFSIDPLIVPDNKELSKEVDDFLRRIDNPKIDAYSQVGANLIVIIIYQGGCVEEEKESNSSI